jgi:hypothetical protein
MLDVSVSYNRYKFLGHEFLTWLWYLMENDRGVLRNAIADLASLDIGNRIVCENRLQEGMETITIKGDDAGLEEGMLALKKGAVVTELNLSYEAGDHQWHFTLKGESLGVSNVKLPQTSSEKSGDDLEGAVLERVYLHEKVLEFVDILYKHFVSIRISDEWEEKTVPAIRKWIES